MKSRTWVVPPNAFMRHPHSFFPDGNYHSDTTLDWFDLALKLKEKGSYDTHYFLSDFFSSIFIYL
jgi:hypothetical protein